MKVQIDCFTPDSLELGGADLPIRKFPVNTYDAFSTVELGKILHNVTRRGAGICYVEIYVEEPHDGDPVSTR